jgi:hypothetical protein
MAELFPAEKFDGVRFLDVFGDVGLLLAKPLLDFRWQFESHCERHNFLSVVDFVDEKASRFRAFQQGSGGIPHRIQLKASRIHNFPRVSMST